LGPAAGLTCPKILAPPLSCDCHIIHMSHQRVQTSRNRLITMFGDKSFHQKKTLQPSDVDQHAEISTITYGIRFRIKS